MVASGLRLGEVMKSVREGDLIITPVFNKWLVANYDTPIPPDIAEWVRKQLTTKPRDRSGSFSASAAGRCYREQELQFLGMPTSGAIDPRLAWIFDDGKWRHLHWQARLLQAGILDVAERPLFWRNKRSRGTIDGLGSVPDDHKRTRIRGLEFGFELKGVNPFYYKKAVKGDAGVKEEHKMQVSRYFLMGGFDLFVTLYEDKGSQNWHEWVDFPDMEYINDQREELEELNDAIENEQLHDMLPQCALQTGDTWNSCDYGGAHESCIKSRDWPNLRKSKPKKKKKRKKGK